MTRVGWTPFATSSNSTAGAPEDDHVAESVRLGPAVRDPRGASSENAGTPIARLMLGGGEAFQNNEPFPNRGEHEHRRKGSIIRPVAESRRRTAA